MKLSETFEKVLNAPYVTVEESGSFFYERDGETLRIYFECTNGAIDWKNNIDFPVKPYRDMKNKWYAHRGFLRVWKAIEPYLKDSVNDSEIKYIEIAGYSHGAAIAALCHEYCRFHRTDCDVSGVGFGCPRVVWGLMRRAVKNRFAGFLAVRCGNDIVTHLPPTVFGYHNAGYLLRLENPGVKHVLPKSVAAHYPTSYSEAIKRYESPVE